MFFGFDTKAFEDQLNGASSTDIEYEVNWCKELLKDMKDGLVRYDKDFEDYLLTLIHISEQELKRRKK